MVSAGAFPYYSCGVVPAPGPDGPQGIERRIADALSASDWRAATTLILEEYGGEVLGFLASMHRDGDAEEVFSLFAEAIWRGAPSFEQRSSARTWAYAVARRVSLMHRRSTRRRAQRFTPFGDDPALADVEERVRTETLTFMRTETRSRLAALRDALPVEDQMLLMLRVDRRLAWDELAHALADTESPLDEADTKRAAARLRKRFQIVKDRLRDAAREAGLLKDEPDSG